MIAFVRLFTAFAFLALVGLCSTFEGAFVRAAEPVDSDLFQDSDEKDTPKKADPAKDGSKKEDDPKKSDPGKDTPKKDGDPGKDMPKKDGDPKKTDPGKDTPKKDGDPKKTDAAKKGSSTADLLNKAGTKKGAEKTDAQKSPYVVLQKSVPAEIVRFDETSGVLNLRVRQYAIVPMVSGSGRNTQIKGELKTKDHEIKAILTDDVKIRVLNPPPLFDDKGRMKRYTPKELKELKGEDTKTPGYPADSADLQPRARIQLDLVLKKEDYARLKSRKKSDDPLPEVPNTNLIIVVAPPPPSP